MDDQDYLLFEQTIGKITTQHTGEALDHALDELGWRDALAMDPRRAISLLFERQGAANASSSALGHVLAHVLGVGGRPGTGVVLPPIGRWDPPGRVKGHDLEVHGLGPAALSRQEWVLIVASTGGGMVAVTVPTALLTLRLVDGMDPSLALLEVTGHGAITDDGHEALAGDWSSALALGQLALAHELVGASRTMLDLACEHALGRIQFGRPISSFQAIRHRLAEALVGLEMADAMLDSAWIVQSPETAAMAKSVSGRQARTTARHCQQVLAGIGFTTEHPLHHYVRRALVLDALLGSAVSLTKGLGSEVISRLRLPVQPPL
jgi:hypothetical protein